MPLLLLRKKVNKSFIIFILIILSNVAFANDSIPSTSFKEHCMKSNAYLLHSYTDVSYQEFLSKYKRQVSINTKLVVNNISGVEEFAFLKLSKFVANHIKEIEVKTLKSDGTIIKLDSSLVFNRKLKKSKTDRINYPIPGVEPGDTIETTYKYYEYISKYELKEFIDLYENIPSFNTEYTVKTNPKLFIKYKPYNNFPEPQVAQNKEMTYVVFKMNEIYEYTESENTCMPCDLPYVYYSLSTNSDYNRTWKDVYNQEFNIITQPFKVDTEKSSYYKKWKKKVLGTAKDSTKYYQFELLHKDIIDHIDMVATNEEELIKSGGYFLKKKYIDPLSIRRLYRQLLEDLEIDYSAVFARSKRMGKIDPYYIRMGEYNHIFFAYDNGHGSLNLLYPHNEFFKYQINEIPPSIYNTQAIITKPYLEKKRKRRDKFISINLKLAQVDSVTTSTITLPGTSSHRNYIRQFYYNKVNLENKNLETKYLFAISGGLSTDVRGFYDMLDENEEISDYYDKINEFKGDKSGVEIDTVLSRVLSKKPPYKYSISAKGKLQNTIAFINDSLVSISLKEIIKHQKVDTDNDNNELNYYLDFAYTDYAMLLLDFPCDIEILGIEDGTKKFTQDFGEYSFELKVTGNKQLTVKSNYKIIKDMIPKEKNKTLEEFNTIVKSYENKRILIKLKINN